MRMDFHSDMLPVKYISHFEVFPPRVPFWHYTVSRDDLIRLGAQAHLFYGARHLQVLKSLISTWRGPLVNKAIYIPSDFSSRDLEGVRKNILKLLRGMENHCRFLS